MANSVNSGLLFMLLLLSVYLFYCDGPAGPNCLQRLNYEQTTKVPTNKESVKWNCEIIAIYSYLYTFSSESEIKKDLIKLSWCG